MRKSAPAKRRTKGKTRIARREFSQWLVEKLKRNRVGAVELIDDRKSDKTPTEDIAMIEVTDGQWLFDIAAQEETLLKVYAYFQRPKPFRTQRSWLNALDVCNDYNMTAFADDMGAFAVSREGLVGTQVAWTSSSSIAAPKAVIAAIAHLRDAIEEWNVAFAKRERAAQARIAKRVAAGRRRQGALDR